MIPDLTSKKAACLCAIRIVGVAYLVGLVGFAIPAGAQTPVVTQDVPATSFAGEPFCFTATIDNTGSPGYSPYLRVLLAPGITFDSATYLTTGVGTTSVGMFPPSPGNQLTDPVTGDIVTGPEGGSFTLLRPPLGSVVTGGPPIEIEICATIGTAVEIGTPLDVMLVPYYALGDTPTGDNGPIIGATVATTVTPTIVTFEKEDTAPEEERAPGPTWPYDYVLTVDVANAQTVNGLVIQDALPAALQYEGPISIVGGSGCTVDSEPSTATPGGSLQVTCTSATGTTADDDVVVSYPVHVVDVLDETACGTLPITNGATFDVQYSTFGGDCGTTPGDCVTHPQLSDETTVTAHHVAVQKGASPAGVRPGDTVTYSIAIQITDFGSVSALVLTDTLPDGVDYVATTAASVGGTPLTVSPSVTVEPDGTTTLVWDLRAAASADFPAGSAGTLTYTGEVRQEYRSPVEPVRAADELPNTLDVDYSLTQGAAGCGQGSAAQVTVDPVGVSKSVVSPQAQYQPGDVVTYRLSLEIPSGDTRDIVFLDYFPLPVFDVATIDTTFGNDVRLAPTDTLGFTPTSIVTDPATNSLTVEWPDVSTVSPQVLAIDVDVTVTDDPFDDNLFLTNLFEADTDNTPGAQAVGRAPVQILVRAPRLELTKGVMAIDDPNAAIAPSPVTLPVDGDATGADAGDTVTYRVTAENVGGAPAYDVLLTDSVPAGLSGCAVTTVTDGTGSALPFTGDLFGAGLALTDPLAPNDDDPAGGGSPYADDTALVTVQCTLATSVTPGTVLTNTASVTYGSQSGATTYPAVSDDATVTVDTPATAKSITATSEAGSSGNDVWVGETVSYRVVVTVPEGTTPSAVLTDLLDAGLGFVSVDAVTPSSGDLSTTVAGGFAGVQGGAVFTVGGNSLTLDFGDLTNANTDDGTAETITVDYTVRVLDVAATVDGNLKNNRARFEWGAGGPDNRSQSSAPNVRVREPMLQLAKAAMPTTVDAGDTITFTLTATHTPGDSTATAHDLVLSDLVDDPDLTLLVGSVTTTSGSVTVGNTLGDTTVEVRVPALTLGSDVVVTFQALVSATVAPGDTLENTASVGWDSLPADGDPDERTYGPVEATETVAVEIPSLEKVVFATSETFTDLGEGDPSIADLAIGEEVTYRITATLPEGVSPQVVIRDVVPSSAAGVLEIVSASVVTVGANLVATIPSPTPVITDANLGDGRDDTVELDFGLVANPPDMTVSDADRIVIEVVARVVDVADNANGDRLTNTASIDYGGALQPTASADVELVVPVLDIQKGVTPTTGDAGDVLTYTIDFSHAAASGADAFDVTLTDVIPMGLVYVPASLTDTGATAPDTLGESGGTITATWDSFPRGSTAQLQFQVTVAPTVEPGSTITNTAAVSGDTLPADGGAEERTVTDSDGADFLVTAPGVTKTVFDTSEPSTGTSVNGSEPDLTIGERVTYRFTVTLPEGTTSTATVVDQLPVTGAVLGVVSSQVVSVGGNLSGGGLPAPGAAGTATDTNADTVEDRVTWTLGTVTNAPDGTQDSDDEIEFEVVAVVLDRPANQGGTDDDLINTASLTTPTGTVSGTAAVDLVEPLVTVAKAPDPDPAFVDAGDSVTFVLTVDHTALSTADAFDLTISDLLPSSPGVTWAGDGTVVSTCPGLITDSTGEPTILFTVPVLTQAVDSCTIRYDVTVDATVQSGVSYQNVASWSYDSTPTVVAGETRTTTGMAPAELTINGPALVKVATGSSLDDTGMSYFDGTRFDLAIGELVDYRITVVLPEGVTDQVVVTDLLPASADGVLEATGATIESVGGNVTATLPGTPVFSDAQLGDGLDDTVTFAFGTVTNTPDGADTADDRIVLTVTGRVVDVPDNTAGQAPVNLGRLTFATGGPLEDDATVDLVEPGLGLAKSLGPVADGVVTVTLDLSNTGSAPAYDLDIEDVFDSATWNTAAIVPGMVPVGWTFQATPGPGAGETTVAIVSDPMSMPPASSVEPAETVSFTFTVPLAPGVTPPVFNEATVVDGSTLPGDDPSERTLPEVTGDDTLPLPVLAVTKAAALLVDADGSTTASPGDTVRYTVTVTNSGSAAASNVLVTDVPDANGALLVGSVTTSAGGTVIVGNTAGDTTVGASFASIAAATSATVTYDVVVDSPLPAGVTQLVNQALVSSDEVPDQVSDDPSTGTPDDPTVVPLDASPDLSITKDDGGATAVPGGTVVWALSWTNQGNQPASGVVVTETVPANTTFDATLSTSGWSCADGDPPGTVCTLSVGTLAVDGMGSATFAVAVDPAVAAGVEELANTATIADDGANGADPTPLDDTATDTTPLSAAPDLAIVKDDGGVSAVPGGAVVWTLAWSNGGDQGATGVTITETVPAHTAFDAGASSAGWSCADGSPPSTVCTVSIGSAAAGASGSVSFAITVDTPLPAGVDELVNGASITDDGTNGPDPTPADNDDTDTTPLVTSPALSAAKTDALIDDADISTDLTPGDTVRYTVVLTNIGDVEVQGVTFTDSPDGLTALVAGSVTTTQGTVTSGNAGGDTAVAVDVGAMLGGASVTVTFDVVLVGPIPAGVDSIANQGVVGGDGAPSVGTDDPDTGTPGDPTRTPLGGGPDLVISKSDGLTTVTPPMQLTYTLSIENVGNRGASGVVVTDTLPAGTSFVSASDGGAETSPDSGMVVWPATSLGVAGTLVYTVTVDVPPQPAAATTLVNTATVSDDGTNGADPTPEDNTATDVDDLDLFVALVAEKRVSPPPRPEGYPPGAEVTWTIDVTNTGNREAVALVLDDAIPAGTTYVGGSLTLDGAILTDAADGDDGSYDGGTGRITVFLDSLLAGATRTVTFATAIEPVTEPTVIANQAQVTGDGQNVLTDDPETPDPDDPTAISVDPAILDIPVADWRGLTFLALGLMLAGGFLLRRT